MDWPTPRKWIALIGTAVFAWVMAANALAAANDVIGAKHISPAISKAFVILATGTVSAAAVKPGVETHFPGSPLKNSGISFPDPSPRNGPSRYTILYVKPWW